MSVAFTTSLRTLSLCLAFSCFANAAVSVSQKGGTLKIKGDAAGDTITIDGTGAIGEVSVVATGFPVTSFIGVRDIQVNTGDGDDVVLVNAIQIGGSLVVKTGAGADTFDLDTDGAAPVLIAGNVDVKLGGQDGDKVDIASTGLGVTIGRNLSIDGAADVDIDAPGASSEFEAGDVTVGGNLSLSSKVAFDVGADGRTIDIDSLNVGGTTKISLGNDVDLVEITRSAFVRKFELKLGGGDDLLDFASLDERFATTAILDGGSGVDTVGNAGLVVFAVPVIVKKIEVGP